MKISVVTVVYNRAGTIADTIQSVASQRYRDIEHIIVDGASTDGTVDILRRNSEKFAKFVSEPDRGGVDAMNKGIRLASGEVIGFLNSDDVYDNSSVVDEVAEVFADPDVEACYADLLYTDPIDLRKIVRYWKSRPYAEGLFEKGWAPANPTFYARRAVYERLGGFDLTYPRAADFELALRFLHVHRIKSVYVPKIWVRMRTGGVSNNSLMGIILGNNREIYRAFRKHGLAVGPLFIARKILSRVLQYFRRPSVLCQYTRDTDRP